MMVTGTSPNHLIQQRILLEAQRALLFAKDIAREQYQLLLFSVPVEGSRIESLHCKLNGQQPALAIFAITVEQASAGAH